MAATTTTTTTWPSNLVAASKEDDQQVRDFELPSGPVEANLAFFTYPPAGQQVLQQTSRSGHHESSR